MCSDGISTFIHTEEKPKYLYKTSYLLASMNYIDVHCHLDTPDLLGRIKEVVENAKKAGVTIIVANGIDPESNKKVLALAKEYDIIKPALGIYPIDALNREKGQIKNNKFDVDDEIDFIQKNGKAIVAIGEVGLDFVENNEREQKEIFQKMIDLAEKLDKPIEIHSRKAEQEVVDMVLSSKSKKIILHCFCGKKGLWKQAADAGCFFYYAHFHR